MKTSKTRPCSYCRNPIPDSGVWGLSTYTDIPDNHKPDCPIREIMEVSLDNELKRKANEKDL